MQYYLYRPDSNKFAGIGVASVDDNLVDLYYNDSQLSNEWQPVHVHGFDDNPRRNGDFPSLSNFWRVPVVSQRAWDTVEPLIGDCCEALPIIHPSGKPFYIVHVMRTIDCLDAERAESSRSELAGRINRIYTYAFKPGLLEGQHIFKLPWESGGDLIVDDAFRQTVEANKLEGLKFNPLPMVD